MTYASSSLRRRRPRGLSVIEVLLGLALGAILLTALATATTAASQSMQVNQKLFSSTQMARVALAQMVAKARTADEMDVNINTDADFAVIYVAIPLFDPVTKVEMVGSTTRYAYVYDGTAGVNRLYLDEDPPDGNTTSKSEYLAGLDSRLTMTSPAASILARNVAAFSVRELVKGPRVISLSISMTVTDSKGQAAFSAEESVACRRTLTPTTVPVPVPGS